MISIEEIEDTIEELVATRDTSYAVCQRLAWLYVVRDHLKPQEPTQQVMPELHGSEFLEACSNKSTRNVMQVVDEFVQTLALTYPTTYDTLMGKIRGVM